MSKESSVSSSVFSFGLSSSSPSPSPAASSSFVFGAEEDGVGELVLAGPRRKDGVGGVAGGIGERRYLRCRSAMR